MMTTSGFKYETVTFRHAEHPAITVDALAAVLKELGYELEVIDD